MRKNVEKNEKKKKKKKKMKKRSKEGRGCLSQTHTQEMEKIRIDPYKYFKFVFGFSEKSIPEVLERVSVEMEGRVAHIVSPGGRYQAGEFEVVSVGELRERAAALPPAGRKGTFSLILGNGIRSRNFADIDVGGIQANPASRGALFQVASNFNCLEFVSSSDSARRGITKYVSDHTQGPAASISCAPATIFRNYFVPHIVEGKEYRGQLEEQICLLRDVPLIPVRNGYVKFSKETLLRLHEEGDVFDWEAAVNRIRVGIQWNAQVTSGTKTHELEMCTDPEQRVSQIFSAAMDMGWNNPADDVLVVRAATTLLRASYAAAVLTARINAAKGGQPTCFLTLMGGGVFGNKASWITDAIVELKDEIVASGVDFRLVLFSGERELNEIQFERLERLAQATGGKLTHV